ncbi:N-acetyltransferase [Frigoribacterium sp. Leaf44]|uniref:N-acetyltransferase n=1 Tax=Frigoribacterium sp. Leaf44 TaxID=1736220 RepID=UPI0006FA8079|nr:N-acetyltransferase [Frigoribacterium sp. Leaf44]KQN41066.1 hypothetical protein ASE87_08900 [Frigoribacterium sp. Leaf44]
MTLSLVPMPTSRLVPWMRRSTAEYEKSRVLAGETPEQAAARHGAETLGLNVFGYNEVARHLYESLGYETTAVQMKKPVTA